MPRHFYAARRIGRTWTGEVVTVSDGKAGERLATSPTHCRADAIARARTLATALSLVSGGSVLPVAMVGHMVH